MPAELCQTFLESVDQAYRQADDDRKMVERSLELSSRELHEAFQSMQLAKEAAEQAAIAKGEFLANMSHEIRTPMNAVIGLTALLLDTGLTGEQREYLQTAQSAGESLLHILNDILDYSRIESRRLELEQCPVSVRDCVESSVELFAFPSAQAGLELVCHIDPAVPASVLGDSTRIRQILLNLIGNAVKFTAEGTIAVSVSARTDSSDGCELIFSVEDTGIGIPDDKLDRIFQSFSQVDCSTTRKYGGTGLGLAISSRLAELMGGQLTVVSAPGRGSTFTFTVNAIIHPAEPEPAAFHNRRALVLDSHPGSLLALCALFESLGVAASGALTHGGPNEAYDVVAVASSAVTPEILRAAREFGAPVVELVTLGSAGSKATIQLGKPVKKAALQGLLNSLWKAPCEIPIPPAPVWELDGSLGSRLPLKILLAEDNPVNQRVLLKLLERFGYAADLAATGREVLNAAGQKQYDLVMMDMHMPEMDGLEATRLLRQRWGKSGGQHPRIVALTASALPEDRTRCLDAGMDDYLTKPIHVKDLRRLLQTCGAVLLKSSAVRAR